MTLQEQLEAARDVMVNRRSKDMLATSYLRVMGALNAHKDRARKAFEAYEAPCERSTEYSAAKRRYDTWRHIVLHVGRFYHGEPFDLELAAYMLHGRIGYGDQYAVLTGTLRRLIDRRKQLVPQVGVDTPGIEAELRAYEARIETISLAIRALELAQEGWCVQGSDSGEKRLILEYQRDKDAISDLNKLDTRSVERK